MAKSTKTSGFDVDKFLQDEDEKTRQQERNALIIEYSIPWNIINNDPPFPGMKLNSCLVRWEPENVEEFIREHGEEVKRFKNAKLTNQSGKRNSDQPEPQRGKVSGTRKPKNMVEQEHQCTDTTVTPPKKPKSTSRTEVEKEPKVMPKEAPPSDLEREHKTASEYMTTEKNPNAPVEANQADTVEQLKKSRVSSKMVNADFDELTREFLHITSLGEKKPVFLPLELRNALETLARLSGVPNLAPSHIVINILKAFFDEHRDLINRKLSGVKLSI